MPLRFMRLCSFHISRTPPPYCKMSLTNCCLRTLEEDGSKSWKPKIFPNKKGITKIYIPKIYPKTMLFIFTSLAFRILLPRTLAPFKSISEAPGAAGSMWISLEKCVTTVSPAAWVISSSSFSKSSIALKVPVSWVSSFFWGGELFVVHSYCCGSNCFLWRCQYDFLTLFRKDAFTQETI